MRIPLIFLTLLFCTNANSTHSNDIMDVSLFYGSWSWETSTNCVETYTFSKGGILQIKSGDEVTDNTFQIIKAKEDNKFSKLTFTTTKDYGGKDCAYTEKDSTGESAEMFVTIKFDIMFNCATAEGSDCWQLKKVK